ncbi:MAG: type VI secretion system tube protein Hcp [Nocardioides sp.]
MTDHAATRRTLLAGTLGGTALGSLVLASPDAAEAVSIPTDPASDFFLVVDGIPGDSSDSQFPQSIEVLDWSWGVSSAISPTNTGSGAGKSKPQPFTFVSRISSATPKLFLACAKGTHIKTATLKARHRGDMPLVYLTLKLENLFVTADSVAPGPVDAFPLEVVTLEYGKVTISFTPQSPAGSVGKTVTAGFDFLRNLAT